MMTPREQPIPRPDSFEPEQAVFYLRVSTPRQMETALDIDPDGLSISTQRQICQEKAAAMGVNVAATFVEPGKLGAEH